MEVRTRGDGPRHQPAPGAPLVEVLFGGEPGGPDLGVIHIEVPVGASMPAHTHGGSDIVLLPLEGAVEITKDGDTVRVGVADAILIHKDEAVALRNAGDQPAQLIVAAAPPAFVAGVRSWPEVPTA